MQKVVFIMVCFLTVFILSCGNSETEQSCVTAFDCPEGKICSGGTCVAEDPSEDISNGEVNDNDGSELPDGGDLPSGDKPDSDVPASDTPDTPESPNDCAALTVSSLS